MTCLLVMLNPSLKTSELNWWTLSPNMINGIQNGNLCLLSAVGGARKSNRQLSPQPQIRLPRCLLHQLFGFLVLSHMISGLDLLFPTCCRSWQSGMPSTVRSSALCSWFARLGGRHLRSWLSLRSARITSIFQIPVFVFHSWYLCYKFSGIVLQIQRFDFW